MLAPSRAASPSASPSTARGWHVFVWVGSMSRARRACPVGKRSHRSRGFARRTLLPSWASRQISRQVTDWRRGDSAASVPVARTAWRLAVPIIRRQARPARRWDNRSGDGGCGGWRVAGLARGEVMPPPGLRAGQAGEAPPGLVFSSVAARALRPCPRARHRKRPRRYRKKSPLDPDPKVSARQVHLPQRGVDHPAIPDIVADWLWILDGCEVSLRTLKAHPDFLHHFDKLTGGNADRILEAAAENAERKGYGKGQRDKDAGG